MWLYCRNCRNLCVCLVVDCINSIEVTLDFITLISEKMYENMYTKCIVVYPHYHISIHISVLCEILNLPNKVVCNILKLLVLSVIYPTPVMFRLPFLTDIQVDILERFSTHPVLKDIQIAHFWENVYLPFFETHSIEQPLLPLLRYIPY